MSLHRVEEALIKALRMSEVGMQTSKTPLQEVHLLEAELKGRDELELLTVVKEDNLINTLNKTNCDKMESNKP